MKLKNGRILQIAEVLSKSLSSTLGSPAQGFYSRKISPPNICLWRLAELASKRAGGLWKTETLVLKGICKTLYSVRGGTEALVWTETGWDSLTKSGESHKEAGVNWNSWRCTLWLQPSWGAHFTRGHWCGQAAFWSPLSSLWSTWAQPVSEGWPWPWNNQVPGQSDQ